MTQFIFSLIFACLYLLPSIIAARRHHNNAAPIFLLNILFGWTIIGWFIPLVWSITGNVAGRVIYVRVMPEKT